MHPASNSAWTTRSPLLAHRDLILISRRINSPVPHPGLSPSLHGWRPLMAGHVPVHLRGRWKVESKLHLANCTWARRQRWPYLDHPSPVHLPGRHHDTASLFQQVAIGADDPTIASIECHQALKKISSWPPPSLIIIKAIGHNNNHQWSTSQSHVAPCSRVGVRVKVFDRSRNPMEWIYSGRRALVMIS